MPNTVWASDRLIYRATEKDDAAFFHELYNSDPVGYTNSSHNMPTPFSMDTAEERVKIYNRDLLGAIICLPPADQPAPAATTTADTKPAAETATTTKPKPTPIGGIHLTTMGYSNSQNRSTMIGLTIHKDYQGKGYGSEAILWATEWAFRHAGIHHVKIGAYEYNTGALRLYERLGFVKEGVSREDKWFNGRFWDVTEFGMLDREWWARYGGVGPEGTGLGL